MYNEDLSIFRGKNNNGCPWFIKFFVNDKIRVSEEREWNPESLSKNAHFSLIVASTNTDHFDIFTQLRILLYVFVYFVGYWRLLLTNWAIEAKDLNKY